MTPIPDDLRERFEKKIKPLRDDLDAICPYPPPHLKDSLLFTVDDMEEELETYPEHMVELDPDKVLAFVQAEREAAVKAYSEALIQGLIQARFDSLE